MDLCIRSLTIDNKGGQKDASGSQQSATQLSLEVAISALLLLLPNLMTYVFDGALYRETLSQLVQVSTLDRLDLRRLFLP